MPTMFTEAQATAMRLTSISRLDRGSLRPDSWLVYFRPAHGR
jgi:hypothetical protein